MVVESRKKKKYVIWSDKQKRCYKRILLGIKKHYPEKLRFLTLCLSPDSKRELLPAFHILHNRIKRLTVNGLIRDGYLDNRQAGQYYGTSEHFDRDKEFTFDYLAVKTSEGVGGVLHILFFGQFIPQEWIYDSWKQILGIDEDKGERLAKQSVDIRECRKAPYNIKRLARYCVNQYVASQELYEKFSCSRGWLFKGFFKELREYRSKLNRWYNEFVDFGVKGYYSFGTIENEFMRYFLGRQQSLYEFLRGMGKDFDKKK